MDRQWEKVASREYVSKDKIALIVPAPNVNDPITGDDAKHENPEKVPTFLSLMYTFQAGHEIPLRQILTYRTFTTYFSRTLQTYRFLYSEPWIDRTVAKRTYFLVDFTTHFHVPTSLTVIPLALKEVCEGLG
jgi:hypothetical protein